MPEGARLSHRSRHFQSGRAPLEAHPTLDLVKARGLSRFLNPTVAQYRVTPVPAFFSGQDEPSPPYREADDHRPAADGVSYRWTSRNNRKGRHQLLIDGEALAPTVINRPTATTTLRHVVRVTVRMFTYYPFWDISWLVAYLFVLGSIVWIINGFLVFLPELEYNILSANAILYGGGITAFIGATIFEVGSVLLMLEAVNANKDGCFGWAVKQVFEQERHSIPKQLAEVPAGDSKVSIHVQPDLDGSCQHHHRNRKNLVGKAAPSATDVKRILSATEAVDVPNGRSWTWFPSWQELRSHYLYELGFLACFAQLIGATVFWIAGFTALPGIYNHMSRGLIDGIYWTPQVVGATGFVISGVLLMVETQSKWYVPNVNALGWHIGLWNLIGGIGFLLSPAFGYSTANWAEYQAACSTFWGSWAFMIGSTIQLYESLEKCPVSVVS